MSYDAWLEAPYQDAAQLDLAYEEYLEEMDVEDERDAEVTFEAWLDWKREL